MEFYEKLQQLRKRNNLTQEQLAEQLFVSRTAVSKWESNRGYPNLESLKAISKLFSVSIDELLSNDELIELAATENRSNIDKITEWVCCLLDMSTIMLIFLPLFGQQEEEGVRAVTLIAYEGANELLHCIYFVVLMMISALALLKIVITHMGTERRFRPYKSCSFALYVSAILVFTLSRQPYVTAVIFVLFLVKVMLMIQKSHIK